MLYQLPTLIGLFVWLSIEDFDTSRWYKDWNPYDTFTPFGRFFTGDWKGETRQVQIMPGAQAVWAFRILKATHSQTRALTNIFISFWLRKLFFMKSAWTPKDVESKHSSYIYFFYSLVSSVWLEEGLGADWGKGSTPLSILYYTYHAIFAPIASPYFEQIDCGITL